MKLKFLGACKEVTGSMILLTLDKTKVLLDCGMRQGETYERGQSRDEFHLNEKVDYCILSHAHIDHSGLLPLLKKKKLLKKRIISTPATKQVACVLLLDSAKIQKERAEKGERDILYTEEDVLSLMSVWDVLDLNESKMIEDFKLTFYDAGHILGACSILIEHNGESILFTGDLGKGVHTLVNAPSVPHRKIDYLIIETTYGNKEHPDTDPIEPLKEIIENAMEQNSRVLIPCFAVGRAQEILYSLKRLQFSYPVYLDSPMAEEVGKLYDYYIPYLKKEIAQKYINRIGELFKVQNLQFIKTNRSSIENAKENKKSIIIAGSGMLEGGRVRNYLPYILSDPNSFLVFVTYQAQGTLGRKLLNGEKKVFIDDKEIEVRCSIKKIDGFSAHADRKGLLNYIENLIYYPKEIFLVHGEEESLMGFKKELKKKKLRSYIPELNEEIDLKGSVLKEKIFIDFEPAYQEFEGSEIYLFTGGIIKEGEITRVVQKDKINDLFISAEKKWKEKLSGIPYLPSKLSKTEQRLPRIDKKDFYDRLFSMRKEEIISKKKLQDFVEEGEKGINNAVSWVRFTMEKGRFKVEDKELNNEIGQILLRGLEHIGASAIQIAKQILEET